MANPTDYNTQITANIPVAADTAASNIYPRMMYHPTLGTSIVVDATSQESLQASDSLWSTVDPNATT